MSETRADRVTVNIDDMLRSSSFPPSEPLMLRVDDDLRSINPKDYDPKLIAIGPIHRGNSKLKKMEEHKKWYLNLLRQRRGLSSVESYVTTIRRLEVEARKCYAEDIQLGEDEFVKMLTLDGCFIIEFLHRFRHEVPRHEDDTIFKHDHTQVQLLHDIMLFENQIPFFIIDSLYEMIKIEDVDIKSLISPLLENGVFPVDQQNLPPFPSNPHHLLGIVHDIQCSSFPVAEMLSDMDSGNSGEMVNISSAVELREAGIFFRRSKSKRFFHIEFKYKGLFIPEWKVTDLTESLIRNLTAYEYYLPGSPKKYFTDYVFFMHCLVHSTEDAKLLRRSGIIRNDLGGDEMVYHVINQLGKSIIKSDKFSYSKIFKSVNGHCGSARNKWMALLSRQYFNRPWALYNFVVTGIILVSLTLIQTMIALLSYRKDLKKGS